MKLCITLLTIVAFLCSCKPNAFDVLEKGNPAHQVLWNCIKAHGGKKYSKAHYGFTFRNNYYTFKNNSTLYKYTVTKQNGDDVIVDKYINGFSSRTKNGASQNLTEKQKSSIAHSLNSVIYFATLPHKLIDPAVNIALQPPTKINGKEYNVLKVHFDQQGGGKDHDDIYFYWINKNTNLIDYLAYNYRVNGGGTRFRSAYNTRRVNGIVFQDYTNYKASFDTPLVELPAMYEEDKLKKLSEIKTENVVQL